MFKSTHSELFSPSHWYEASRLTRDALAIAFEKKKVFPELLSVTARESIHDLLSLAQHWVEQRFSQQHGREQCNNAFVIVKYALKSGSVPGVTQDDNDAVGGWIMSVIAFMHSMEEERPLNVYEVEKVSGFKSFFEALHKLANKMKNAEEHHPDFWQRQHLEWALDSRRK